MHAHLAVFLLHHWHHFRHMGGYVTSPRVLADSLLR